MNGWIPLSERRPEKHSGALLVTNNIQAMDQYGKMTHLWITHTIREGPDGKPFCYAYPGHHLIRGLTHWMPAVPAEWKEKEHPLCQTGATPSA